MVTTPRTRKPYGLKMPIGISRMKDTMTYNPTTVRELDAKGRANAANENKRPPAGFRNHKVAAAITIIHFHVSG